MPDAERMFESQLARHDLVWLDASRWREASLTPLAFESMAILDDWFARGLPAVVCRQDSVPAKESLIYYPSPSGRGDGVRETTRLTAGIFPHPSPLPEGEGINQSFPKALRLGVALSPARGRHKLSVLVDRAKITHSSPPLSLAVAAVSAPDAWRAPLARLAEDARALGIELRVYGSLAWQHLSGDAYMTPTSDVDLLWRANDAQILQRVLQLLRRWEQETGLRADGELLLPDGSAVAWRELTTSPDKVLVKHIAGVELRRAAQVLSALETPAC